MKKPKQAIEFEEQLRVAIEEKENESKEKLAAMAARLAASGGGGTVSTVITRGFPIPHYDTIEPKFNGDFSKGEFLTFAIQAAAEKWTGLLVVDEPGSQRFGFFDKGGPVGWRSEPMREQEVGGSTL